MPETIATDCTDPLFLANLRALSARWPAMARAIGVALAPGPWTLTVETAKDGSPTLKATSGDAHHYLHSRFDPVREAAELVEAASVKERRDVLLIGLGLGYTLEAALAVLPPSGRLLVIEPDPAALRVALETRDLSGPLHDPRVRLALAPGPEEAFGIWATGFSFIEAAGVAFVHLPNIQRHLPQGFDTAFDTLLRGYIHTVAGNMQTLMVMAHVYLANTMRAVPYLMKNPGVNRLFNRFANIPVVCVAAGPSLDMNIHQLAEVQDRCLIIACDTATRPLINAGVTPHLICAGDPQEANHRHVAGLADQLPSYFCAEPMTYPATLREFRERLFLASFRDRLMTWFERTGGEVGQVLCWGSVATMVFDLARRVGGNPIIFIGQDLSFPGDRTYAQGTYFETELGLEMTAAAQAQRLRDPNFIECTDLFGAKVRTNRQMFAYHRWFVNEIARTERGIRLINATEGGILKEGVEIRTFADTVEECFGGTVQIWDMLHEAFEAPVERDTLAVAKGLRELADGFAAIDREAKSGFRDIGAWYRQLQHLHSIPEKLAQERYHEAEGHRKSILGQGFATILMEMGTQAGIKSFLTAKRDLDGKSADRVVYVAAIEAYLRLFASVSESTMRLRGPAEDAVRLAEECLAETRSLTTAEAA